jgi:hypothetical protein
VVRHKILPGSLASNSKPACTIRFSRSQLQNQFILRPSLFGPAAPETSIDGVRGIRYESGPVGYFRFRAYLPVAGMFPLEAIIMWAGVLAQWPNAR